MECPEITSFLMSNIYFREDIIYLLYSPIRPVQNFKALWKYLLVFKNSFQITSTFMNLRCVCVGGGWYVCNQLCQTFRDPMDYSLAGSSVHEIFQTIQTKILKWVAISSFRGSSRPRYWTWVSCLCLLH